MTAVSGAGSSVLADPLGAADAFGDWAYDKAGAATRFVRTGVSEIPNMTVGQFANLIVDGVETGATATVGFLAGALPDAANAIAGLGGDQYKMYNGSAIGGISRGLQGGIDTAEGYVGITKPEVTTPGAQLLHGGGTLAGAVLTGTFIVKGAGAAYNALTSSGSEVAATAAAATPPLTATNTVAASTAAAPSAAPTSIMASRDAFMAGVGNTTRAAGTATPEAASFSAAGAAAAPGSSTAGVAGAGANAATAAAPQAAGAGSQSWLSAQWMRATRPLHVTVEELWKNGRPDLVNQFLARARVTGLSLAERDGIVNSSVLPQMLKDAVRDQYIARTSLLSRLPERLRATTAYMSQYPGSAAINGAVAPVKFAAKTAWDMAMLPTRPVLSPVATFFGASRAGQWGSIVRGASGLAIDQWLFDGAIRQTGWNAAKTAGSYAVPLAQSGLKEVAEHTSGPLSTFASAAAGDVGLNNLGEAAGKLGIGLFQGAYDNLWIVIPALLGAMMGGSGPNGRLLPAILMAVIGAGIGYALQNNAGGVKDGLTSVFTSATNAMGMGDFGRQTYTATNIRPPMPALTMG